MKGAHFAAIVAITAATWATVTYFSGLPSTWERALKPFLTAITTSGLAYWIFEKYAWRWPLFRGWFVERPDLRGVWEVSIVSNWTNEAGERVAPITAYMMIRQTFSSLTFRQFSRESSSVSIAHAMKLLEGDLFEMIVTYRNIPQIELQATRSRIHHGAFLISGQGYFPTELTGHYWTDRQTSGSLKLSNRRIGEINSYDEGSALFEKSQ